MRAAEEAAGAGGNRGAAAERRALAQLQKAEEECEQVSQQRGGGGGGGGAGSVSEDLAELFKQDMDKLANQYETAQGAQQQQADQEIDALMENSASSPGVSSRRPAPASAGDCRSGRPGWRRQPARAGRGGRRGRTPARAVVARAQSSRPCAGRAGRADRRPIRCVEPPRRETQARRTGQRRARQLREAQRRLEQEQGPRAARYAERAADGGRHRPRTPALSQEAMSASQSNATGRANDRSRQIGQKKLELEAKVNELEKQIDRMSDDGATSARRRASCRRRRTGFATTGSRSRFTTPGA